MPRHAIYRGLIVLGLTLGVWQFGQGAWIQAKAALAQYLIAHAWQQTLVRGAPVKPWPWADTWPVARLQWRDEIDLYVLASVNGASLPFGPGLEVHDDNAALLVAGHRDTHFAFLRYVHRGDRLRLTGMNGETRVFQVQTAAVIDSRETSLYPDKTALMLVTCYPFDALRSGGALRYVVSAIPVTHPPRKPLSAI